MTRPSLSETVEAMKGGQFPSGVSIVFPSAREAERRIAGVAAAARIVRELAEAGCAEVWLAVRSGEPIGSAAMDDVHRLAGPMTVRVGPAPADAVAVPGHQLIPSSAIAAFLAGERTPAGSIDLSSPAASAEILRRTGKASDGVVSRWLNRPVSQRLSALFLRWPGMRPIHATVGTAVLASVMFAALVGGGHWGLIAGAILFHAASVFDGVDGEIARATFRTSPDGAALDSAIDMTTNVAAMLGLAINLSLAGQSEALPLVAWALAWFLLGLALIGWRSFRRGGTFSFDGIKQAYHRRMSGPLASRLISLATLGTSRDFCALVYLLLVLAGIPVAGLYLFAVVTPVWFVFVAAALLPRCAVVDPREAVR